MTDLRILHGQKPNTKIHYASPGASTEDVDRLSTRFLSVFLSTPKYGVGTDFLATLKSGQLRTSASLISAFTLARVEALAQLQAYPTSAEETIVEASLIEHQFLGDSVYMRVRIRTQAAVSAEVGVTA